MADDHDLKPAMDALAITTAYDERFGRAGDFDCWIIRGEDALHLMQEALERGSPVARADLERAHRAIYGRPYPDEPGDLIDR